MWKLCLIVSVHPFVCQSVHMHWYCVRMNQAKVTRYYTDSKPSTVVFSRVKFIDIFDRFHPEPENCAEKLHLLPLCHHVSEMVQYNTNFAIDY